MTAPTRPRLSLDGQWDLEVQDDLGTAIAHHRVEVPGAWTTQVPGAGDSHATVLYRRVFTHAPTDAVTVLRFDGVNHHAAVTLNGTLLGEHAGAWEPFEFDATEALRAGENVLEVVVSYPPRFGVDGEPGYLEVPHGKQSWYGTTAGIWQQVSLESRPTVHIAHLRVWPDGTSGAIHIAGRTTAPSPAEAVVTFAGQTVATATLDSDGTEFSGVVTIPDPRVWGPGAANLYDVTVRAGHDALTRTTGLRTFEARDGKFFLNGEEIELRAVLDQDYHPGSELTPASTEEWEDLLLRTRELGFTMLRVHIKRPDPRYYEIADRLGMLVWTELPSWLVWTQPGADAGLELLERFIAADEHHPSIVMWTIINEAWGLDMTSPRQRTWLRDAFHRIKKVARGSLVVDNSACVPNFHMVSDVDDYHFYRGIPESRREWDAIVDDLAGRPEWSYSPYGDAERRGDEPLMLSEYGNWGLPHALDQYDGADEPWWFGLGAHWAYGVAEGTRLRERFMETGLADVFGSWDALVAALQHAQGVANAYQTTSIRMHSSIAGYVLTQLSDVQWEANGLFDMNRTLKAGVERFALTNGPRAVALRPSAYSASPGESVSLAVMNIPARTGTAADRGADGVIELSVDGEVVSTWPGQAADWATHEHAIVMTATGARTVAAELVVDGEVVARDEAEILVVAAVDADGPAVFAPGLEDWAQRIGLDVRESLAPDILFVTTRFTEPARAHARDGGRVLVLVEEPDALDGAFDLLTAGRVGPRTGDGDWVPRTEWLDRRGPFASVPGDTVLRIAFEDLLGEHVLTGIPNAIREARVYSGIFSGWLRGVATTTATVRWSEGAVTLSTLRVRHAHEATPLAATVARALVEAARR